MKAAGLRGLTYKGSSRILSACSAIKQAEDAMTIITLSLMVLEFR